MKRLLTMILIDRISQLPAIGDGLSFLQRTYIDMYMSMLYSQTMKDTRLIALIERKQMKALKAAAKRKGVSLGEVVRRAISSYLKVK
jgi:hypothetical protein